MPVIFGSAHEPKTLSVERTDDGRLRLIVTLRKLGQNVMLEYYLDPPEATALGDALRRTV